MPRRPAMRSRTFKASDQLWSDALKAADDRGQILAEELRKFLESYAGYKVTVIAPRESAVR